MAVISFKGQETHTEGQLPGKNTQAPDFTLIKDDLSAVGLKDFQGKRIILNIFPSIDTDVCAASVRKFNEQVSKLDNTVVLCISKDLPFAQKRFCAAEGLDNVITLSQYQDTSFSDAYGVLITGGPLKGLLSRAVVVIDTDLRIIYTEQVPEITTEPDYRSVFEALS